MGTKYSSQSASSYNSSPPADDASTAASNRIYWATIKTKLADVLKTFIEAVNSQLTTALDTSSRAITSSDTAVAGDHDRVIQANTSTVIVTLSDAATMAAGYMVGVHNNSAGNITIARATGGDTINGSAKNITLGAQQRASFRVNAAANGYIAENANPLLMDATDASKQAVWDLSGITTATRRTLTLPDATGTVALTSGQAAAATQAELEAASLTTVYASPGRQHFHPGHPKAWALITPNTTVTASYPSAGVSVVRNSAGSYTITHGLTFSSANYAVIVCAEHASQAVVAVVNTRSATQFGLLFFNMGADGAPTGSTPADPVKFTYCIFGDL